MAGRNEVARRLSPRSGMAGARVAGHRGARGLSDASDWAFLTGDPYPPAGPATEREALALPPFGRGLALLANAAADTDWHAYRWDSELGVNVRLANQPNIVTDPDPTTTTWNYRWAAVEDLVLYGNHFAFLGNPEQNRDTNNAGYPSMLAPVSADDVWVMYDPGQPWAFWWAVGGALIPAGEMFHVSAGNRSGSLLGRGVLAQYAEWLGVAVAAETHAGAYFAAGAMPPAVLQSPTQLTEAQGVELKTKWRAMTSSREPVVLPMGYVLTPVVTSAEAAQLVQSRTWNAEATAMLLGVPPHKLGLQGPTMTYQNVETADIDFIRDSVTRFASPLAAAFTKWLMPRGVSVRFDYTERMRADQRTTSAVLTAYTAAGILSTDEARSVMGRPPAATTETAGTTPAGTPELTPDEVA